MAKQRLAVWRDGLFINLLSNGVCIVVGGAVAYLKHEGSEWVSPLVFGALAWLITMGIWVAARAFSSIPIKTLKVTNDNLPEILRGWLDDLGLKVQSVKDDAQHILFIVTTDGGKVIAIARDKGAWSEYLTYRAYFKDAEQTKYFADFTDHEKQEARLTIQLEISRAVMGYTTKDILEDFTLFKRIPISSALNIEDVTATLWEVEAVLSSVFIAGARLLNRKRNQP